MRGVLGSFASRKAVVTVERLVVTGLCFWCDLRPFGQKVKVPELLTTKRWISCGDLVEGVVNSSLPSEVLPPHGDGQGKKIRTRVPAPCFKR